MATGNNNQHCERIEKSKALRGRANNKRNRANESEHRLGRNRTENPFSKKTSKGIIRRITELHWNLEIIAKEKSSTPNHSVYQSITTANSERLQKVKRRTNDGGCMGNEKWLGIIVHSDSTWGYQRIARNRDGNDKEWMNDVHEEPIIALINASDWWQWKMSRIVNTWRRTREKVYHHTIYRCCISTGSEIIARKLRKQSGQ